MRGVWGQVVEVIRRYPSAAVAPAAVFGTAAAGLQFFADDVAGKVLLGLALAVAFEFYVAYLERLWSEFERGATRVSVVGLLRDGAPMVPSLLGASLLAVTLPLAASGLLVLPGLWLATRWSLFAPVISNEGSGPMAAIRRSNDLVRGHFWPVFVTVTLALLVEGGVIGAALRADSGVLAVAAAGLAVAAVSPPAALMISAVYARLADPPRRGCSPR
jgi:hypothetical protein